VEKYTLLLIGALALLISAILGPVIIPILHRLKFGQEIREIGPSWHKKKSGTPTMGGFIFIIPVILVTLIMIPVTKVLFVLLFSFLFGIIGFIDDFIKVILKRNLGLTEKQKSLLQILCALLFVFCSLYFGLGDTKVVIPFVITCQLSSVAFYSVCTFCYCRCYKQRKPHRRCRRTCSIGNGSGAKLFCFCGIPHG